MAHQETQPKRMELTGTLSTLCHSASTATVNMRGIAAMRELTVSEKFGGSLFAPRKCCNRAFTQRNRTRYVMG
jgi:hypothetical protein